MLNREFVIAALNGLLWATLVAVAAATFDDITLGWVIATAMIVTILVAAVGSLLPGILRKLSIDPAIAGGVVLTTITDVVGFFVFLGLGSSLCLAVTRQRPSWAPITNWGLLCCRANRRHRPWPRSL